MLYLLAILLPPLAVFLCAKPVTALLNCCLCLACWVPGVVHACLIVSESKADKRASKAAVKTAVVAAKLNRTF